MPSPTSSQSAFNTSTRRNGLRCDRTLQCFFFGTDRYADRCNRSVWRNLSFIEGGIDIDRCLRSAPSLALLSFLDYDWLAVAGRCSLCRLSSIIKFRYLRFPVNLSRVYSAMYRPVGFFTVRSVTARRILYASTTSSTFSVLRTYGGASGHQRRYRRAGLAC